MKWYDTVHEVIWWNDFVYHCRTARYLCFSLSTLHFMKHSADDRLMLYYVQLGWYVTYIPCGVSRAYILFSQLRESRSRYWGERYSKQKSVIFFSCIIYENYCIKTCFVIVIYFLRYDDVTRGSLFL